MATSRTPLSASEWNRARGVYLAAIDQAPQERSEWLADTCRGDDSLLSEVQRLLAIEFEGDFLEPPDLSDLSELESGQTFDGLKIVRKLGQGGYGVVYLAHDIELGRDVAVKLMRGPFLGDQAKRAFLEEARCAARVEHPNVARVHRVGVVFGAPYIVMSFVAPGRTLAYVLSECRSRREPSDVQGIRQVGESHWSACARVTCEVAGALHACHEAGLLHRDVKPSNILINENGGAVLVDFGISREIDRTEVSADLRGTPHYMSPEQARVLPGRMDARSDVYSLGVVLFELLTLKRPFDGESFSAIALAIRDQEHPRVRKVEPGVHPDLEIICHAAIRRAPDQRYPDCCALEVDLRRFLDHEAPLVRRETRADRVLSTVRRHRTATRVAGVALLTSVVVAFAVFRMMNSARVEEAMESIGDSQRALSTDDLARPGMVAERVKDLRDKLSGIERAKTLSLTDTQVLLLTNKETELREEASFLARELTRQLSASSMGHVTDPSLPPRIAGVLEQAQELLPASDRSQFVGAYEAFWPKVTIRSVPSHAQVFATRLDEHTELPASGSRTLLLGQTDLISCPLEPGLYQLDVISAEGKSGQIHVLLSRSEELVCPRLFLRDLQDHVGMQEVAAGNYRIHVLKGHLSVGRRLPSQVWMHALRVDTLETTNKDYRVFCEETGRRGSRYWPKTWRANWDTSWDHFPVFGVTFHDAEAYAAWAGKRLLTALEWEARDADSGCSASEQGWRSYSVRALSTRAASEALRPWRRVFLGLRNEPSRFGRKPRE